jgi:hypothetical protein
MKQSLTAVRHCEPKGWQVCLREAISQLHIPFSVKCFEGIASPDYHQARNDAPFRHCEERSDEAISSLLIPVEVRRSGGDCFAHYVRSQ